MIEKAKALGTDSEFIEIMREKGVEIADNASQQTVNDVVKKMLYKVHVHSEADGCYGYAKCPAGNGFSTEADWIDDNGGGRIRYVICKRCGTRTVLYGNEGYRCDNAHYYQIICAKKGMTKAEIDTYK